MDTEYSQIEINHMQLAIELAEKAAGLNRQNPLVGAVVAKGEDVISSGYHLYDNVEHAERIAIRKAAENAKGAVLYVNLEPCVHHGRTPPCVDAIIESGIAKVFFSIKDPDERVNGKSEKLLNDAGIGVDCGLLSDTASELNRHYLKVKNTGLPWVIVKVATSLDGRIGIKNIPGEYFSCDESLRISHMLRALCDGIMVGANTIRIDNPRLTCRLGSFSHVREKIEPGAVYPQPIGTANPVRITISRDLNIPVESNFLKTSHARSVAITGNDTSDEKINMLKEKGVEVLTVPKDGNQLDIHNALEKLVQIGIYSLVVEGGGELIGSLIRKQLVDEIYIAIAPVIMGDKNTISWISWDITQHVKDAPELNNVFVFKAGRDLVIRGRFSAVQNKPIL
ncbi:MAG: bifunctional diaminohydroxyphosphoribosylaminopyrimidine deaminase/5-amino-6-(5-phosphoribosylamino)uracil reductase RibD [bacterium]